MQWGLEEMLSEAEACMGAGQYREAARLLEAAARDVHDEALPTVLTMLGAAHSQLGDYGAAERELHTALALRVKALGDDHPDTATTRYSLAESYRHTGRVREAIALYGQVLETRARDAERAPRALATALFGIGQCFFFQGDLARAEAAHDKALELRRRALSPRHEEVAESLLGLASVRHARGDVAAAAAVLSEAIAAYRALGAAHPRLAVALNELGGVRVYEGRFADAEPLFAEALAVARAALPDRHPDLAPLLGNLLECRLLSGAEREALALCREANAIEDAVLAALLVLGPRAVQVELGERAQRAVDVTLSLALTCFAGDAAVAGEVLDLVLRRKGVTLEASTARRDALRTGRFPELRARLDELAAVRREHAQAALGGATERSRELKRRRDALEVELGRCMPELGLELRLRMADRHALAAALPAGGVLVEYVSFRPRAFGSVTSQSEPSWLPERYAALVLRAGEPERVTLADLGPVARIDELCAGFLEGVAGPAYGRGFSSAPRSAGRTHTAVAAVELRSLVLDPLTAGGVGHLVVAPVGTLAQIPFELLPTQDGGRLLDARVVSYVDVGRDVLRFGRPGAVDVGPPLVLAGPDFGEGGEEQFASLDGARAEGRNVARRLGVEALEGGRASAEAVLGSRRPCVLHLATHGFFFSPPQIRGIVDGVVDRGPDPIGSIEDPMLRSGVALAGANAGEGLLTADELSALDLDGTELVVLSACDTGRGDPSRSEGVFGLRRAFALSGARTVVMSLWKVPDDDTRELMELFYRGLLVDQLPRAEALRAAQRALAERWPDQPSRWGAFICQGDPSPMARCL